MKPCGIDSHSPHIYGWGTKLGKPSPLGGIVSTIYTLTIEPMTKESFAPFGELWNPDERPSERRIISRTD